MLTNPRADRVAAVRSLARRSVRQRVGRFLVEGPQPVREAVRWAAGDLVDLYATQEAAQRYADVVEQARDRDVRVHLATPEVLAAMGDTDAPQGLVAVCRTPGTTLAAVLATGPSLLVLLTNVRDPGNAGTVIRGADAAGADAVLVSAGSVDVHAPKVVRSTAGSIFHLPVVTGLDIDATLAELRTHGIATYAADGAGPTLLGQLDLGPAHTWVMGNEAWGLTEQVRAACDRVVRIPIHERTESLNLAMAATLCLFASADARRD